MSYAFDGNHRSRPEQNLSGSSRKNTRDILLQRAHDERQKRQAERLRLKSTGVIQSYARSYLARKKAKQEQRELFDKSECSEQQLISKLLFFYDPETDEFRLISTCEQLIARQENVMQTMSQNGSYSWLIKRLLANCLKLISKPKSTPVVSNFLDIFSQNCNVLSYLIGKGYYKEFRRHLHENEDVDYSKRMINRPFEYISASNCKMLDEYLKYFMMPHITYKIKNYLIPYLDKHNKFPYSAFISFMKNKRFDTCNNILYSLLALEPKSYVHNSDSILILSRLSCDLHTMSNSLEARDADSDSDTDMMEINDEDVTLQDFLLLFNKTERVKNILSYFSDNCDDMQVVESLTKLCHSMLLVFREPIRKFMLLYMLTLRGTFLNKLWGWIKKREDLITNSPNAWKDAQIPISVFCNMFTFYTETITDSETTDASETFTLAELKSMCELLKSVTLNMIEMAFPLCRTSPKVKVSPDTLHLYNSTLKTVKMLHTLDVRKNFCDPDFWTSRRIAISPDLTKRDYLSKTLAPFSGIILDEDYEVYPPLSTIEQRSLAMLQKLPFMIEFSQRVMILRQMCFYSLGNTETRFRSDFYLDNALTVRRNYLYEDAFDKFSSKDDEDMKHRVRIQFINNVGLEEAGIDGGGIFKEFINEVIKTAFDPNRGFFLLTADNTLYPNPQVHLLVPNFADHYYFIGRLVGKAILENILVDLPLAEFFLAKILVDRASAHYLKSLDPVLYRNLLYLRDYQGDVQDLGLDFTLVNNDLGETRVIELKPNGANIPVTNYNRLEYIHRLADLKLNTQIKKQCAAFRHGIHSVVPLQWLRLFNHNELQIIIAGDFQEMDIEDLRLHTAYGGEFTDEHPIIVSFWKILRSFTDTQKKMLLKFVTSCSRPPLLGFKELNPSFCIQSSGSDDRMPTASTCLNLLKLPLIKDEETLRKKLVAAIEQQAGFELS